MIESQRKLVLRPNIGDDDSAIDNRLDQPIFG
jgi:hypothetical protein